MTTSTITPNTTIISTGTAAEKIHLITLECLSAYDHATSLRGMACGDDDAAMDGFDAWVANEAIDPEAVMLASYFGRQAKWSSIGGYEPLGDVFIRIGDLADDLAPLTPAGVVGFLSACAHRTTN